MPTADLGPLSAFEEDVPTKAEAGGRTFVVVRRGEGAHVLDHACQHLGAPLSKGTVVGDEIVCPWHRACFRLADGARSEPPGFDEQRAYGTEVKDGRLVASWDEGDAVHPAPDLAAPNGDARRFAIVGAGAAGLEAAQSLRAFGFAGTVLLIDREAESPYDRTKLSKGLTKEAGDVRLRDDAWLKRHGITLQRGTVEAVEPKSRTLTFEGGVSMQVDGIVVAPGAEPNRLDVPGADAAGVVTLRSVEDALRLAEHAKGAARAVVVGSGFIGMEAATVLSGEGVAVTVLARDEVPFAGLLGERIGKRLRREQEAAGVRFLGGTELERIEEGEDGLVAVAGDERLPADLVVMAVGVRPRAGLLSGIEADEDGGVTVEADLTLPGAPGVVLAGDLARVPTAWGAIRVEHWRWAQQLGRLAARTLTGQAATYEGAPFFWSKQQADGSYVYVGHAEDWDETITEGDVDEGADFAVHYVKDGRVMATFGHGMADRLSRIERRMAAEGPVPMSEIGGV